ncbi:MAG TPA: hydroxysqualene dehydroxylase HpnE [Bacteroidota bacterium]|nr:hydroxysqualene dehydroxylase HpnE [Bacteroidota bacterium]
MNYDVLVMGGGLSGLSAAVELSHAGKKVLLLEQKPHLGGRAYSFVDRTTGDVVDNGQHLLMGCYHATRRYLDIIGSAHLAILQPQLHIDFLRPAKEKVTLHCPNLPAPLHVLVGLINLNSLPATHRLKLLNVGRALVLGTKEDTLAGLTVDQWLRSLGQTEEARKYLWDIIAIGTLNDDPKTVSALLFYRVLKAAFLGKRENSSLLVPRVGLSDLFVEPAVEFLKERGSEVLTGHEVEGIGIRGRRVEYVQSGRRRYKASSYISAVPYFALEKLVGRSGNVVSLEFDHFESSPILTIHLWFDKEVMEEEFAAVLDCRIQWVFNRTRMVQRRDGGEVRGQKSGIGGRLLRRGHVVAQAEGQRVAGGGQYLAIVISGAKEYLDWSKEKLVGLAMKELRELLPGARLAKVLHSLVVKEKRATFSPKPHVEQFRPQADIGFENLFLAGDWTDTGYPATIEGAVMSGKRAADACLDRDLKD